MNDIQCPTELRSHTPVTIDWLLNYAIQLEHSDQFPSSSNDEGVKDENENAMKVVASTSGSASNTSNETSELHQSAPFNLYVSPSDLQDSRVKDSLAQLAQLLNFPPTTNQFALLKVWAFIHIKSALMLSCIDLVQFLREKFKFMGY